MSTASPTYSDDFLRAHPVTAGWEGGWSNHKADPGGKTMFGVTEAKWFEWLDRHGFKRRPVRSITKGEALQLYYEEFWTKAGCENLFPGVDLAVYDASVNSGVSRGRKWLVASLDKNNRHDQTVKNICARRLSFVQALKQWKTFGRGWSNRIADVQAKGVAWALAAMGSGAFVEEQLRDEAKAKSTAAKRQGAGAGASGITGGGSVAIDPATGGSGSTDALANQAPAIGDWLLTGIGVALFVLAAWLVWRAVMNNQQAKAFSNEAETVRHA